MSGTVFTRSISRWGTWSQPQRWPSRGRLPGARRGGRRPTGRDLGRADGGRGRESEGDAIVSTEWGDVTARQEDASTNAAGTWSAARDVSSMYSLTRSLGIQDAWAAGITGDGVTVAVIDTGVAPVRGLERPRTRSSTAPTCPSTPTSTAPAHLDEFGHGTHMAGIIAGRDADVDRQPSPRPASFAGVAPEAQLLNMKVGAGDGGVDVSQVDRRPRLGRRAPRRRRHGRPRRVPGLRHRRRCSPGRSTRSPARSRTPGAPASWSWPPPATTVSRPTTCSCPPSAPTSSPWAPSDPAQHRRPRRRRRRRLHQRRQRRASPRRRGPGPLGGVACGCPAPTPTSPAPRAGSRAT